MTGCCNDNLIDIADFGVFIAQWGAHYDSNNDAAPDGDTPCGVFGANRHADADGDGALDIADLTKLGQARTPLS